MDFFLRSKLVLAVLILSACATQALYSPAERPDEPGYRETRLTENRYRVTFVGHSTTPSDRVKNYALLRAAELTTNAGYDWFRVVDREIQERHRGPAEPRISFGVGRGCHPFGCRILGSPWYTGVDLHARHYADRYRTSMEIVMGKGQPDAPNDVYNAEELAKYLREETPAVDRD